MVSTKQQILDIAMNLHRIGGWAADDYLGKQKRIGLFLKQTDDYIQTIKITTLPQKFQPTMDTFLKDYKILSEEKPVDVLAWAESLMTWGNILTHRAKFLD